MLERAAQIFPEDFRQLRVFAEETAAYADSRLVRFVDEVRFYLAYLDYITPMQEAGLRVCYPQVHEAEKEIVIEGGWDLALGARLAAEDRPVVPNDLALTGVERILVISGPNQGGKTTTARRFGQACHLAAIGCPVPGRHARIFLPDQILTIFEREERLESLEGRLGTEVMRIHQVLSSATTRSVIVINEVFASTALQDARVLTRDVLERISELDAFAACVTFIDEMSRLNEKTVSMVSRVDPADPSVRTFRVERRVADGRAYARALAAKHSLTGDQIRDALSKNEREEDRHAGAIDEPR